MKIDLEKAYDRLNWDFIFDTLQDIGIPPILLTVIMKCFTSTKMHISWNRVLLDEFRPTIGVRQGDP